MTEYDPAESRAHRAHRADTSDLATSRRTALQLLSATAVGAAGTGSVAAFDALVEQTLDDGTDAGEWVLRLEDPLAFEPDGHSTPAAARAATFAAQEQVLDAVDAMDGVSVLNQFWAASAVLVESERNPAALRAVDGVRTVHPNFEVAAPEPVDRQRLSVLGQETTYGLQQVDAPAVWETFDTQGEGARVAVLDTGAHEPHTDIEVDGWREVDGQGDPVDSAPHDPNGHGTHVAGTAVGRNAGTADIGVAPAAEHYHAKVFPGGERSTTFAAIVAGMEWAAANDADVANMSLGVEGFFPAFIEPVRTVQDLGTLVVCSSGNQGAGTSGSPGNVFETAAVGATDEREAVAGFSSGQQVYTPGDWAFAAPPEYPTWYVVPDVATPGVDVRSAATDTAGGYELRSGTSMAAPHATGILALASSADPEMGVADLQDLLAASAFHPGGAPSPEPRYGSGVGHALNAVTRRLEDGRVVGTATLDTLDGEESATGAGVRSEMGTRDVVDAESGYALPVAEGARTVEARRFGFEATESVTVAGETELDLVLDAVLDIELRQGQPPDLADGDSFELVLDVAHVDALTVDLSGPLAAGVTGTVDSGDASAAEPTVEVVVDGESVELGEPLSFAEPFTAEGVPVEVTVTGAPDGSELVLEHSFAGPGESVTVTTGPTTVKQDPEPAFFEVVETTFDGTVGEDGLLESSAVVENTGGLTGSESVFFIVGDVVTESGTPVEEQFEFPLELAPGESATLSLGPVSFGSFPRQEGGQSVLTVDPESPDDTAESDFLIEGPLFELLGVDISAEVEPGGEIEAVVSLGNGGEMAGNAEFGFEFAGRTVASPVEPVAPGETVTAEASVATDGLAPGSYDYAVAPDPPIRYDDPTPVEGTVDLVEPAGPPPLPGFENAPQDLDGDGLFEDIDGNGTFDVFDVQALFDQFDSDVVQNNAEFFDFDGGGDVTIFDVQELFERLQE